MADDLDDFFQDIEDVEKEAVVDEDVDKEQTKENDEHDEPPTKKVKTDTIQYPAAPIRPKGMIVAASSSVILHKKKPEEEQDVLAVEGNNQQLPFPEYYQNHNHSMATGTTTATNTSSIQPPLPTGPPPPPPPPPLPNNNNNNNNKSTKQPTKRMAAGKVWIDPTLDEWPDNDFRVFCGNLDRSTTEPQLFDHFNKYASIAKAKIVKDPMGTSKGYGFISFLQPLDCAKAIREMDQTWLGSRPIRVKRSDWKDRNLNTVMKKNKKESKQRKRRGV